MFAIHLILMVKIADRLLYPKSDDSKGTVQMETEEDEPDLDNREKIKSITTEEIVK